MSGSKGTICWLFMRSYGLTGLACLFYPTSRYRVYDVKDAKFMGCRRFAEMCVDALNENSFRLDEKLPLAYESIQIPW